MSGALAPQSGALVAVDDRRGFAIQFFLSPGIPAARASALRAQAAKVPNFVQIVESDTARKALIILADFDVEIVRDLEKQGKRIIGLPFAERFFQDPGCIEKVKKFPLFDFVLPYGSRVCCSGFAIGLTERVKMLTEWLGAEYTDKMEPGVSMLLTRKVSLHHDSKYQAALVHKVPIVKMSYLESIWQNKLVVDMAPHAIPALGGLGVSLGPLDGGVLEKYTTRVVEHGGVLETVDKCEVLIAKDVFSNMYKEAKKMDLRTASPAWLDACFKHQRCLPILGELEVKAPKRSQMEEGKSATTLSDCVICLLYMLTPEDRDYAKSLAWKCGAITTLSPFDWAITHVVFKVSSAQARLPVSVTVDPDRTSFVDISWLEACAKSGKRPRVSDYPQQQVVQKPERDTVRMDVYGERNLLRKGSSAGAVASVPTVARSLSATSSHLSAPSPLLDRCDSTANGVPHNEVVHVAAVSKAGVFAGLTLAMVGWDVSVDTTVIDAISRQGGSVLHGAGAHKAVLESRVSVCVCKDFGAPQFASAPRPTVPLVTPLWVRACVADNIRHLHSSYPHFEPGLGPLPLRDMSACVVRITALQPSSDSKQQRERLQELVEALGARVATPKSTISELTHVVCAEPSRLEKKMWDIATKKQIPIVSAHWLLDSFSINARQPEARYAVSAPTATNSTAVVVAALQNAAPTAEASDRAASQSVLAGHKVLISPCALGGHEQLPRMAELLGAAAHTWTSTTELKTLLQQFAASDVVVLVERDEMPSLAPCLALFGPESRRETFARPTWLLEVSRQRRRLKPADFTTVDKDDVKEVADDDEDAPPAKKPRQERVYAWQTEGSKQLTALAEESRAHEQQSRAEQKRSEGLRLAELRREPSRTFSSDGSAPK